MMGNFSVTEQLQCSIETAFDYVSNVDNRTEWQKALVQVNRETPAPDGEGTYWEETFYIAGQKRSAKLGYTAFERPTLFVEAVNSPISTGRVDMVFSRFSYGCSLTVVADLRWCGWFRFLSPIMTAIFKKTVKQDLLDIKRILESK